jgi:ABC-2 type transport system permease protein
MRKALAVAIKEVRQIRRDRRTLLILIFVPAVFLLIYGYALNFDIRHVRLAVDDPDRSPESRALVSAFVNSGYFDYTTDITTAGELEALIDRNAIRAALVIPQGYGRDLSAGRPVTVQVIIDGDNANTATTVMGYAQAIVAEVSTDYAGTAAIVPPLQLEPRVWYNPQLRSTLFLVPGLIAYIAMITAVTSTALSIVREKERGTMEQIRMAPLSPVSYIVGKSIPYLLLSLTSSFLIVGVAMALFDLPMQGSWLTLLAAITLFLIGAQAQGLVISSVAPNQQVAFQIALLSSLLPTFILSGFIFPIASMPEPMQYVTLAIPARYFIIALRAIVLKGADLASFAQELMALGVFALVMLALAAGRLGRAWRVGG